MKRVYEITGLVLVLVAIVYFFMSGPVGEPVTIGAGGSARVSDSMLTGLFIGVPLGGEGLNGGTLLFLGALVMIAKILYFKE
ncbi:MAG: hypothetical protein ACE5FT_05500 [Candidatus Nanoarchaeia archaeon]